MTVADTSEHPIVVDYVLSEDQYVDAMLGLKKIQTLIEQSRSTYIPSSLLLIAAAIILARVPELTTTIWVLVVLGIVGAVFGLLFGRGRRDRVTRRLVQSFRTCYQEQRCHIQNLRVDESGFRTECPCGKHEFQWSAVSDWYETSQSTVVQFSNQNMLVFPHAVLGPMTESLKQLLRLKIKESLSTQ